MWINSALGQWDQDARLQSALRDADRRRMLGAAGGSDAGGGIGSLLNSTSARLHRQVDLARRAVNLIWPRLETPTGPRIRR